MRDFLPKVKCKLGKRPRSTRGTELGIRFAFGVGASPRARTREAEATSDRCVVVVTVYREEAFVDLPERASEVQRPADRVRHRDLSRFVLKRNSTALRRTRDSNALSRVGYQT